MITVPDNSSCNICGSSATIHVVDNSTKSEQLFCDSHKPEIPAGQCSTILIRRFRLPPNNSCSLALAADEESTTHKMFFKEMCDLQLLGGDGACRYYLSRLTNSDQFALWSDEFVQNVREYIVTHTNGSAACFPFNLYSIELMLPYMKYMFFQGKPNSTKISKQDQAINLLLQHPSWSDKQLARAVPTSQQQLNRNSHYKVLRNLLGHQEQK